MYQKAAEKGNICAQTMLGRLYLVGDDSIGFMKDESKGLALLTQAADKGHGDAINQLGWCYFEGKGVEGDKEKARQMWEKAASMGHAESEFDLATSMGSLRDPQLALPYLKGAAEKGHTVAIGVLGEWYLRGYGVEQDDHRGVQMCTLAAKRGHAEAIVSLALHVLKDSEGAEDNRQAREYLEVGAEQGNTTALLELGRLYRAGIDGIPADYTKAARDLQEAADGGEYGALIVLAFMYEREEGFPRDEEKFKALLLQAGEAGELEGYYHLACWYTRHNDHKKGGYYLFLAAEGGDLVAQGALLHCYRSGYGMFPIDEAKFAFWKRHWRIAE